MIWHNTDIDLTLKSLEVSSENGLSNGVVDIRLNKYGKNIIKNVVKPSFKKHFINQLKDKNIYILSIIAIISLVFSIIYQKNDYYSPLLIIAIVLLNAVISAYQMFKSDVALNSLRSITDPVATVIRDGIEKQIPAEDLVPGDIILIKSGDYIPADARLIDSSNLSCNEFILTGEDIPVNKKHDILVDDIANIPNRINMVFSGCMVLSGNAKAVVCETGLYTELGHTAALNQQSGSDSLPIKKQLDGTGKIINTTILFICAIVFLIQLIIGFNNVGFANTTATALLNAMALAVAAIPEGLPAISTIAVALGIERIIKDDIIIKKVSALEVLGKTSVICADKTGIITKNSMTVKKIFDGEDISEIYDTDISDKNKMILRIVASCSTLENDSTENSIKNSCEKLCGISAEELDNIFPRVAMIPFDSARKTTTSINMIDGKPVAIIKGATESLADRFSNISKEEVLKQNEAFASEALRVVCVAIKNLESIPINPDAEFIENDLTFIGLIGLEDPLRIPTIDAIKLSDLAGIKTIMITGDNLITAKEVARRAGILKNGLEAISGEDLAGLSDDELVKTINKYAVFARITPEDKLRIISALQANGEIVTITGDDLNDVQALANADIGCAMGRLKNDAARANADIIINNSYFDSVVNSIKESRGLFANIQKGVAFLLSCNIAEVLFYLVALIIFKKPPITAVQLLWINLLTDCAPVMALATAKAEDCVMRRRPSTLKGRIFDNIMVMNIVVEALYIAIITFVSFIIGMKINTETAMTMSFLTLSLTQIFHSFNARSSCSIFKWKYYKNDFLIISSVILIFIICFLTFSPAGIAFALTSLNANCALTAILLSISIIPFVEVIKLINKAIK